MNKYIQKIKNLAKNISFEQAFIILISTLILSVLLFSIISPTTLQQVISPRTGNNINSPKQSDNPFESKVNPEEIVRLRVDTYLYQNGQVVVDNGIATYYFQKTPTDFEIQKIKDTLSLDNLTLVDETYKAVERLEPINPPEDEPTFHNPIFNFEQSDEGIGPDAIIDVGDE